MTPRSETLEPAGNADPSSTDAPGHTAFGGAVSRYVRVVPVLFVLLFVAVAALAISPELRHQLAQSFTRQDKGYLELFFADEQTARTCPADTIGTEKRVRADVAVRSHFDAPRSLAWTVSVNPTRGTVRAQRGRLEVDPGATGRFTALVPVEPTAGSTDATYTVTVTLDGHAERLLLHC